MAPKIPSFLLYSGWVLSLALFFGFSSPALSRLEDKAAVWTATPRVLILRSKDGLEIKLTYTKRQPHEPKLSAQIEGRPVDLDFKGFEIERDGSIEIKIGSSGRIRIPEDTTKEAVFKEDREGAKEALFKIKEINTEYLNIGFPVNPEKEFSSYVVGRDESGKMRVIVGFPVAEDPNGARSGSSREPTVIISVIGMPSVQLKVIDMDNYRDGGSSALTLENGSRLIVPIEKSASRLAMSYQGPEAKERMVLTPSYVYPDPLRGQRTLRVAKELLDLSPNRSCLMAF